MYKRLIIFCLILSTGFAFAKKVKFSVDMTGQTISPNGVHISGDFQTEAGYPTDWDSKATALTKEGNTNIYSVTVNIPAFRKYEYKFVNGDQFYEVEFVPEKSRVGYDFNDNRWIYIDSLDGEPSTSTTNLQALKFGGNAPAGKWMIRFRVDMKSQTIHSKGVHVTGNFVYWNDPHSYMYSFANKVYEYLAYFDSANIQYTFVNGHTIDKRETMTGACVDTFGMRYISISSDTVLEEVCFQECKDCVGSVFSSPKASNFASLYPNPSQGNTFLKISNPNGPVMVSVKDFTGRIIGTYTDITDSLPINTNELGSGIYLVDISNDNLHTTLKLVVD